MNDTENSKSVWKEPFYKERTIGKCVSTGISIVSNRFPKIFRLSLPAALLSSIISTAVIFSLCDADIQTKINNSFVYKIAECILVTIAFALMAAFAYRCVDVHKDNINILSVRYRYIYNIYYWNIFKYVLICLILMAAVSFTVFYTADWVCGFWNDYGDFNTTTSNISPLNLVVYLIALGILFLLIIPLYMAMNVLVFEKQGIIKGLIKGYVLGWRKWARIFAMEIMISVLVCILSVFLLSPAYVIALTQHSATLSRLQGDAVNIPEWFPFLTIGILFISSFILSIITFTRFIPHALLYATIKCEEKQDADQNK